MKKQIILLAMMLLPMVAGAETVKINGIYYNLVSVERTIFSDRKNYLF